MKRRSRQRKEEQEEAENKSLQEYGSRMHLYVISILQSPVDLIKDLFICKEIQFLFF